MSGVRGDARKRQSQPAPEVRMTEAERMAYLAGYEFALSHIHDEPVQADLALLSSDTTEAPGVRAIIEREVAKERERVLAAVEALAVQANDEAQTHWHYHNEAADDCDMDRANREGEVAEAFDQTRSALRILVASMREVTP